MNYRLLIPLLAGLIAGLVVSGWHCGARLAELRADHAEQLAAIAAESQRVTIEALQKQQAAEQALADLDQLHTKELTDAQAENDRLRTAVADGTRRLRIAAKCPANLPDATGAAGLDHDGTVELDRATGQTVYQLRESLIADRAKILALQAYVREVCRR